MEEQAQDAEFEMMCEDCEQFISKEEWDMFNGKCEECALEASEVGSQ